MQRTSISFVSHSSGWTEVPSAGTLVRERSFGGFTRVWLCQDEMLGYYSLIKGLTTVTLGGMFIALSRENYWWLRK